MNLESCFLCRRPVLELRGQFTILHPYQLEEGDEAIEHEAYGWCHLACLVGSEWGRLWHDRLRTHFLTVRGYHEVAEVGPMRVLQHPRTEDVVALDRDGVMLAFHPREAANKRAVAEGCLLRVRGEMNLEFDDAEQVALIRAALSEDGQFPLLRLVDMLGIASVILTPRALERGALRFDKKLKRRWGGRWVSAHADYELLVPREVLACVGLAGRT
ncbi:hypothetical protein [Haliangium sp.]|uniref:hypothetical protein n=1 Tax=Haliangium sp. TaxID=2663208 RepID=UPI003D0DD037